MLRSETSSSTLLTRSFRTVSETEISVVINIKYQIKLARKLIYIKPQLCVSCPVLFGTIIRWN